MSENNAHPFQYQADRQGTLMRLQVRAWRGGFWVESSSLSYSLMELVTRLLLSSGRGSDGEPIPPDIIERQRYLMDLATLARDRSFMPPDLWNRIRSWNGRRADMTHGLAQGRIKYEELKAVAWEGMQLYGAIQNEWLQPVVGKPQDANFRT